MVDTSPISFPEDAFVEDLVASGRYADATEVWREALTLLAARERERDDREAAQLSLLHDVLARDAAHPPLPALEPDDLPPVIIPLAVDADAVLSEIELLLSTRTPKQYRKAG